MFTDENLIWKLMLAALKCPLSICVLLVISSYAFALPPSPAGGNFFEMSEDQPSYLQLKLTPRFGELTPNMTIEAWVFFSQLPSVGQNAPIVSKKGDSKRFALYFGHSIILPDGKKEVLKIAFATCEEFDRSGNCGVFQQNLPNFQFNQWHHIALTFSQPDREIAFYIDGMGGIGSHSEQPEDPAYFATKGILTIGGSFDGAIDELRISNEIIYRGQFRPPRRLSSKKSTLALWHFDEPSDSGCYWDTSGRDNTLFKPGFPVQAFGQLTTTWGKIKK